MGDADDVHFDSGHTSDVRVHVHWNTRSPLLVHTTSISFWGMCFQEVARNVRSINLHALGLAAGAALSAKDHRIQSEQTI